MIYGLSMDEATVFEYLTYALGVLVTGIVGLYYQHVSTLKQQIRSQAKMIQRLLLERHSEIAEDEND